MDIFFDKFDFSNRKYDVYIGYSHDISPSFPLFEKLVISDLKVSMLDLQAVPLGIKTRRQKTILCFEAIESYDMYSAFEIANALSSIVVNSYSFFRHDPTAVRTYGQVKDERGTITTIRTTKLLKHRVSLLSQKDSNQNAESLIKISISNYENLSDFVRITRIHNSAIHSENTSDSLLSLWSILESVVETDSDNTESTFDNSDTKKERSKIGNVIAYTVPYLKSTYIQKLVETCMKDIVRWNKDFFDTYIANNGFGENDLEHTFAFLAFESTKEIREKLYCGTEDFPLLRYRVYTLSEQLCKIKNMKNVISRHVKRVTWHLYRIYRARNYIIHDASANERLNQELLVNLHSYVDTLVLNVINLITNSPYDKSIPYALVEHKLSVQITDEILGNKGKEIITPENALKYLYYAYDK